MPLQDMCAASMNFAFHCLNISSMLENDLEEISLGRIECIQFLFIPGQVAGWLLLLLLFIYFNSMFT